jgi:hypothetical protein
MEKLKKNKYSPAWILRPLKSANKRKLIPYKIQGMYEDPNNPLLSPDRMLCFETILSMISSPSHYQIILELFYKNNFDYRRADVNAWFCVNKYMDIGINIDELSYDELCDKLQEIKDQEKLKKY